MTKTLVLTRTRHCLTSIMVVLALAMSPALTAQECLEMLPESIFDTTDDCSSIPNIDRALGAEHVRWNGVDYLFVNIGNEIAIWDISQPQAPVLVDESEFRVGNQGDSDYDLMAVAVCDDCRWGAAWYKTATVLFDLGEGSVPRFMADEITPGATFTFGGLAFTSGEQQYLVTASGLTDSCAGTSTLYKVDGFRSDDLTGLGCLMAGERTVLTAGGVEIDGYLYLGDSTTRVFLYQVEGAGDTLSLTYLGQPMRAFMGRDDGLAIDKNARVAVEANNSGARIWDLSDPAEPRAISSIAGTFDRAAVAYPRVFLGQGGLKHTEHTYDISRLDFPAPLDQGFWDPTQPWNHADHSCSSIQAAHFSPDASTLYLLRYSRLELVDASTCETPPYGAFYLVPGVAKTAGAVDSFFLTTLVINNGDDEQASLRLLWLPRGEDNHTPVTSSELIVAPGATMVLDDVLGTILDLDNGAVGALAVIANTPFLHLASRTFNQTLDGTYGQGIPGLAADDLIPVNTRRRILFFVENERYRSNLGLVNGTDRPIRILWERFAPTGESLQGGAVDLPPWGNTQLNLLFSPDAPINGGYVDVWTTTEGGAFAAYGSMLDNLTSDPTTMLPQ